MPESFQNGTWLLVDAAGPSLVTGLLQDGRWLACRKNEEGFLESLKPDLEALLDKNSLRLPDLQGCLFAAGPGSTLGLRLAAMFLGGLLRLPAMAHWRCLCYNNLSLACAGLLDPDNPEARVLLAPWRRDRMHSVIFEPEGRRFVTGAVNPADVSGKSLQCVILGNRVPRLPETITAVTYPAARIPEILSGFPELLGESAEPVLYVAEETEFARWSAERHAAR